MSFEIGDIVTPVVNLTSTSGNIIPTAGVSGTVDMRMLTSTNTSGTSFYNYQVLFPEKIPVDSGTSYEILADLFWFTDVQLGGEDPNAGAQPIIDLESETLKYNTGQANVNNSVNQITGIQNSMNTNSWYYDMVKTNLGVVNRHSESLTKHSTSFETESGVLGGGKAAGKAGDLLGFDAQVFLEMSENALGYHDVFEKAQTEYNKLAEEVRLQNEAALEDNAMNFKLYYDNYVKGGNVLIPQGADPSKDTGLNAGFPATYGKDRSEELVTLSGLLGNITFPSGRG
jgi:hypothetical protein